MMRTWEENAEMVERVYAAYVNWTERFYECPECGEPIYEEDWTAEELEICPVCGFEWEEE